MDKEQSSDNKVESPSLKERMVLIANELIIGKDGRNTFSDYDYIRPDDLQNALKPLLLKYKVFYFFNVIKDEVSGRNIATLELSDFDSEYEPIKYSMEVEDIIIKGANSVQSAGGVRTYCKRYLLMDAFDIADNADDLDNNKTTEDKPTTKTNKSPTNSRPTDKRQELIMKAKAIAIIKSKIDLEATLALVTNYSPETKKIADIVKIETLNELITELKKI